MDNRSLSPLQQLDVAALILPFSVQSQPRCWLLQGGLRGHTSNDCRRNEAINAFLGQSAFTS